LKKASYLKTVNIFSLKSKNELAKQKLLQLDFAKLAQKNTIIPKTITHLHYSLFFSKLTTRF